MTPAEQYTALLDLSRQMVELACQQSWEALEKLETQRNSLLDQLPKNLSRLSPPECASIAENIRQIQECDRTVLEYVMPWREHAGALLARLKPTP